MTKFKANLGSVWDSGAQRKIDFVDGIADVSDPRQIEFLTNCGFEIVAEPERKKVVPEEEPIALEADTLVPEAEPKKKPGRPPKKE